MTPRKPHRPAGLKRLLALRHPDPHAILGAHVTSRGVVVRAYRPGAREIDILIDEAAARPMEQIHPAGLFELHVPQRKSTFPYRLKIRAADGTWATQRDPYAFPPTMGELDLHLLAEGRHERLYEKLGAHVIRHEGIPGISFAVWAPNARSISLVGDFNGWDGRVHPMRSLGGSGIWELFVPDLTPGHKYKYEIHPQKGPPLLKADPYARHTEPPPATASVIHHSDYRFGDAAWMKARAGADPTRTPVSIYEVHLGSWRGAPTTYREAAPQLAEYAGDMGFTHVELLPIMEHPYGASWGYQVGCYFAPTARYGDPDDFRFLVDHLHQKGIGVILDWVPAHFPKDDFALGRFDGTALYEHADPSEGEHPDWGTYVFNFGRHEVRNFLISNALFWLSEFHVDGLRLDAVASMLYRDYSRRDGEWTPNIHGGRENLEAVALIKQLNEIAHARHPGVMMIAEESTTWPGVSRPTFLGGLGFGFKWNLGWMHDTLTYFSKDPIHRRFHHHELTFGLHYAWSENFILPLSHDEVVYGKGSLLSKMPGDERSRLANLRALFGFMWAHPGKKLLFMGGEWGQPGEWRHDGALEWGRAERPEHSGLKRLVRDLNTLYRSLPVLWEGDGATARFEWIDAHSADDNVVAFMLTCSDRRRTLICIGNFSGVRRDAYRIGLPRPGRYREILNTDATIYGGENRGNMGTVDAEPISWHGRPCSAVLTLPPLSVLWIEAPVA